MCSCERNVGVYRGGRRSVHPRTRRPSPGPLHIRRPSLLKPADLSALSGICLGHSDVNVYTRRTSAMFFFYDPEMCVCSSECVEGWWRLIYRHQQECETCHTHQVLVLKLGTRLILSAVCACYVFSRCMLVCKCQVMLNIFASIFFSQFSLFQNCNARLQIASALISKREYDNHNGKLDTLLLPFFSFFGEGKRGNNTLRLSSAVSIC